MAAMPVGLGSLWHTPQHTDVTGTMRTHQASSLLWCVAMFRALVLGAASLMILILAGCTSAAPVPAPSACATQPGTWACQVEQYERVDQ